jgi:hypothetical protein
MDKLNLTKTSEWANEKYSVVNFSNEKNNFSRIVANDPSICLLPFDLNPNGQISHVYLAKYHDYLKENQEFKCLTDLIDLDKTDSEFESIQISLNDELGLTDIDVNDVYYLGTINHNIPFSKEYKCFAINLTNYSDDPSGFTPKRDSDDSALQVVEKVKFNKLLTGEINDSLALSASFLLMSYK